MRLMQSAEEVTLLVRTFFILDRRKNQHRFAVDCAADLSAAIAPQKSKYPPDQTTLRHLKYLHTVAQCLVFFLGRWGYQSRDLSIKIPCPWRH
jgi:hypothetical protein